MTKSIIQTKKECYVCGTTYNLHRHHVYAGRNRQTSEKFGCVCYLCGMHHNLSDEGVHFNIELDRELKDKCQRVFELLYSHIEFMYFFGKNYKQPEFDEGDYKFIKEERK